MHVAGIKRLHVRAVHDGLINHGHSRDKANKVVKVLRRTLSWAIELGLIAVNPASKMGLQKNAPREEIWYGDDIRALINKAIELEEFGIALATAIGYDSSQRPGDVIRIPRSNFNGAEIKIKPSKTKKHAGSPKWVWAPLRPLTIGLIGKYLNHDSVTIVVDRTGKPYKSRNAFSKAFREVAKQAGIRGDLQFRDIRRTVASEILAGGGRSEPITGHAPGSPAIRVYEVPSLAAAKSAQAVRQEFVKDKNKDKT